jgi:D-beta-D-heptose 7-phosphate kinase/D-beta-D-heptose 1-phosphate adenosyltransferase
MLDEYIWGRTERISPEAPVQVVEVQHEEVRLGGAGNVIHNLSELGCKIHVSAVIGDDQDGQELLSLLGKFPLNCDEVYPVKQRVTSRKTRVLANRQQMIRIDREKTTALEPFQEQLLLEPLSKSSEMVQAIIVSDYLKGNLTDRVLKEVISYGKKSQTPVIIDPKGKDFSRYRGATVLTPNLKEAQLASGIDIHDEESLLRAGRQLCRDLALEILIITRSEEGMTLFYPDGRHVHFPTQAQEVYDVSGAGDTVVAFIGASLAAGLPYEEAVQVANLAAGLVVGKLGTSSVTSSELVKAAVLLDSGKVEKILDREELATVVNNHRESGKKIVFTNGCFDLLHVGHVKYLQKARSFGDLLILGLNSDDSVKRLKGEKRPLIRENERAHILAALDCVDLVTIFNEDTPLELISLLKPDVLVKGGDYSIDGVIGRDLVESWGGTVQLVEFVGGRSTTSLIDQIIDSYQ